MASQEKITPFELFKGFGSIGLSGFGGVLPFAYAEIVEKRKWLNDQDFAELIALAQLIPGPNITNFAAMFGYRVAGIRGVVCAVGGLLGPPGILILFVCSLYQKYSTNSEVIGALHGMMAVSAGLIFVTGAKMLKALPRHFLSIFLCLVAIVGVGYLRMPLLIVLIFIGPLSIVSEWIKYK